MTEETLYPHEWLLRKRVLITVLVTVVTFTVLAVLVPAIVESITLGASENWAVSNNPVAVGTSSCFPTFIIVLILLGLGGLLLAILGLTGGGDE